jgi:hypothetical protein
MAGSPGCPTASRAKDPLAGVRLSIAVLVFVVSVLAPAAGALAGQAASGELLFYPCASCHPVTLDPGTDRPSRALPNGFKGHEVALEGHDRLGGGDAACLVCHDGPGKDPGRLKVAAGGLVDIRGDVAQVCYRCHSAKYREWMAGTHGKRQPKCTSTGCHDPHTPGWIYAGPLLPFVGNGLQFKVLSERAAFSPLAPPAPAPPVETPAWFAAAAVAGLVAAGVLAGRLVLGRLKR